MPTTPSSSSSSQPLLPSSHQSRPHSPTTSHHSSTTTHHNLRARTRTFLSSSYQHYIVLSLVSLDLLGIFADIIITLSQCDLKLPDPRWDDVRSGLGIAGLVFSCLFMLELAMSVWAFGLRYFSSTFHTLDALVILASFTVDVVLHGVLEEVASLVVILRLWRFFKIIEEFSVGASEQMAALSERIGELEAENRDLKAEMERGGWKGK